MKSLNRTLSLVLVLVMVFGLFGVASAAFTDTSASNYTQAINVMAGTGVINGTTATVAYSGNRVPANLGVVKAQVGDWVLVHAGLVIQVLSESQAQEINNLLAELETLL